MTIHHDIASVRQECEPELADRIEAHLEELMSAANRAVTLLERQLQDNLLARSHCRWTEGGELVLIGDVGRVGPLDKEIEGTITALDGKKAEVRVLVGRTVRRRAFSDCRQLFHRGDLPDQEPPTPE